MDKCFPGVHKVLGFIPAHEYKQTHKCNVILMLYIENQLCRLGQRNKKKDPRNEFLNISVMAILVCHLGCIWNELNLEQQLGMPVTGIFLD